MHKMIYYNKRERDIIKLQYVGKYFNRKNILLISNISSEYTLAESVRPDLKS